MAIYTGFSDEKWWFSIAMLVHQRVYHHLTCPQVRPSVPIPSANPLPSRYGSKQPVAAYSDVYLVAHPTARKWVITPVISGLTLLIPFITGVITHLLSGMSHQVAMPLLHPTLQQMGCADGVNEKWQPPRKRCILLMFGQYLTDRQILSKNKTWHNNTEHNKLT